MKSTLMEGAYATLRKKIEFGELAPGTQLVNRTLSSALGVSTVTIREALHRLTSEGLVTHVPNAGAFVRKLNRRQITDLFKMRNALEMFTIDEAFARIDEDQLAQLEAICQDWRRLARSIRNNPSRLLEGDAEKRWIANEIDFHRILVEAASNSWLTKIITDLRLMSRFARNMQSGQTDLASAARTYRMHVCIVRALKKRDLAQARYWMNYHNTVGLADARRIAES